MARPSPRSRSQHRAQTLAAQPAVDRPIEDLDTPCLLLNAGATQRNLDKLASFFTGRPAQLRPHFKNHKCTTLARKQLQAGNAVGITCAKLGEAEVLADHGFDDVLVANQVVGREKLRRLVALARRINIRVAIDHIAHAMAISEAASAARATVGILIEVDLGMGRCGVTPGQPALQLAQEIIMLPGLRFDGIQAYEGHVVYINDRAQRDKLTRQAMQHAVDSRQLLEEHGIAVGIISGGSTGTYAVSGTMDGVREIQAGTYATMDWRYQEVAPEFEVALSIMARVISRPKPDVAVIDLGVKGAGSEFGLPRIKGHPDVEIPFFLAEEHCVIKNAPNWKVGEAVEVIPSHACTTCNLYRQFFVHEAGKVVDIWPIEGSGKLA